VNIRASRVILAIQFCSHNTFNACRSNSCSFAVREQKSSCEPSCRRPRRAGRAAYQDLWHIEESFRMLTRPPGPAILHGKKDSIDAHLTLEDRRAAGQAAARVAVGVGRAWYVSTSGHGSKPWSPPPTTSRSK
jgi:hypothetical protein